MDGEWKIERLGGLCTKIGSGATPRGGDSVYKSSGVSLIRSQNVYNEGFHRDGLAFIDEVQADALSNVEVQPHDVLLNITGDSVARSCQVPDGLLPARVNQHVAIIRPKSNHLHHRFLRYVLVERGMQNRLLSLAGSGATRNALTKGMIEDLSVPMPPLPVQHRIADILGSLDDKIELNRRTNETLEAMARALFKSWFVDFDPVVAKSEGRQPEGMDAETAKLFPSSFEDSEIGRVPKGWKVSNIGDCVTVVGGSTPRTGDSSFWNGTHCFCTPKDLSAISSPVLLDTERKITDEGVKQISSGLLEIGTVLLSSRAPIGYLAVTEVPTAVNQGFIAMVCDKALPNLYVLRWAEANMDVIKGRANGTTFMEVSKTAFRPIQMVMPPPETLAAFMEIAGSLHARGVSNLKESTELATARDALLPRLLSGDLRLRSGGMQL